MLTQAYRGQQDCYLVLYRGAGDRGDGSAGGGVHLKAPTPSPPSEWRKLLGGPDPPQEVQQPLHVRYIEEMGRSGG